MSGREVGGPATRVCPTLHKGTFCKRRGGGEPDTRHYTTLAPFPICKAHLARPWIGGGMVTPSRFRAPPFLHTHDPPPHSLPHSPLPLAHAVTPEWGE